MAMMEEEEVEDEEEGDNMRWNRTTWTLTFLFRQSTGETERGRRKGKRETNQHLYVTTKNAFFSYTNTPYYVCVSLSILPAITKEKKRKEKRKKHPSSMTL
jgi:hypothetical protein